MPSECGICGEAEAVDKCEVCEEEFCGSCSGQESGTCLDCEEEGEENVDGVWAKA